jgi:hypothetical protein
MLSLNDEARESMLDTLDALRQWRNEINAVNDRYLTKALDRMAAAEQAMGWPDHATSGSGVLAHRMHYFLLFTDVRDALQKASKLETDVIDKIAEACFASRLI